MSKPKPARDRTTNWSAYNAALRKRGSLLIWLDKEMAWHAPHEGRTRSCHSAIIARGGTAIIPIRKNGRPWKEDCPAAQVRNETLRAAVSEELGLRQGRGRTSVWL